MELKTFKVILFTFSNFSNITAGANKDSLQSESTYQTVEVVIIALVTGSLSLITITGNILVLLSIIINSKLQTINNYFLFSLACADLIIGLSSMNLYIVYIVVGYWPLGPVVCDLWLAVGFAVNNSSALQLLIIGFDRYFCITKPLSYPARRTSRIAEMMIAAVWIFPFVSLAPVILFWQFIVGERTVPEGQCYVQFLANPTIIFITEIFFFYLPVIIMSLLYWQISRASKSRVKKGKRETKQENLSSCEAENHITMPCDGDHEKTHCVQRSQNGGTVEVGEKDWSSPVHPERNEIAEAPAIYEGKPTAHCQDATMAKHWHNKKASPSREKKVTRTVMAILLAFVVTWTPYNVTLLINTFCLNCIPYSMWTIGHWLCYINSTINPACYALCNVTFKKTFKQLLLCQHKDIHLGK